MKSKTKERNRLLFVLLIVVICFINSTVAKAQENAESTQIDCQLYYYNQLTDLEKELYNVLVNSKEDFLNNKPVKYIIGYYNKNTGVDRKYYIDAIQRAENAYMRDNAEVQIWLKDPLTFVSFKDGTIQMVLRPNTVAKKYADINSQDIRKAIVEFETKAENFAKTLKGTDAEKLKQIYKWLTETVSYDYTFNLPNTRNAYGAIVQGRCVCSGFAYAYKYVADLADLKVLYVQGKYYENKPNQETYIPHAWNIAYVNEEWVLIDATFGATAPKKKQFDYLFASMEHSRYYPDEKFIYPEN